MSGRVLSYFQSPFLWWLALLVPFFSLVYALYAQYVLAQEPCVLCIHIRIYLAGIMLVGAGGLILRAATFQLVLRWLIAGLSIGLALKSWELFGVEKGFIDSSCFIDAGLPVWFNLEAWLPALFEVRGLCGQSPDVIFGLSMAELLMPVSIAAAGILSFAVLSSAFVSAATSGKR